jgi:drug/metabolite transporter (DMT)-like permease
MASIGMGKSFVHSLLRLFAADQTFGVIAGILSAASIGFASFLIYLEASELSAAEILTARSIFGLSVTLPLVWNSLLDLLRRDRMAVWIRAVAGAVSQLAFAWNLQHTSVGLANMLFNFSLFLTLAIGSLVGEVIFSVRTFIELGLIAAGTWLYWYAVQSPLSGGVIVVGMVGATAAAVAYTALKKASRVADPWLINWAVCLASIPVSLLGNYGEWVVPSWRALLVMLLISIGILVGQYLLIVSFSRLSLALATALTPSSIVWSVIADSLVSGRGPAIQSIAGSAVYAIGIGSLVFDNRLRQHSGDRHPPL